MFKRTQYIPGDWNVICDVCGHKYKASQLMKRWDGLMVCQEDWETRHPQELIRPIKERNSVPWTRPRPEGDDVSDQVTTVAEDLYPSTFNITSPIT